MRETRVSFAVVLLLALGVVFGGLRLTFAYLLTVHPSFALDWRTIWQALRSHPVAFGPQDPTVLSGFFTPPWGVLLLKPLAMLSLIDGWALSATVTLLALLLYAYLWFPNAPRGLIVLVLLAHPTLRVMVDGNLEGFVLLGLALLLYGFQQERFWMGFLGLWLALLKPQLSWLVIAVWMWGFFSLRPRWTIQVIMGISGVFALSLGLWGKPWFRALFPQDLTLTATMGRGSPIDISLLGTLHRLGVPWGIRIALWLFVLGITAHHIRPLLRQPPSLNWPSGSLPVSAALLLSPYVSGNGILMLLPFGVIPLWHDYAPRWGWLGIMLFNLPYVMPVDVRFWLGSFYAFLLVLGFWLLSLSHMRLWWRKVAPQEV